MNPVYTIKFVPYANRQSFRYRPELQGVLRMMYLVVYDSMEGSKFINRGY